MNHAPPIRSRAAEEGSFEIPLWGIPFILIVLYVCLFSGLGVLGFVGPDEPRYAAIARAMAETHDWVTPRLWGSPWFEKPVLYYWAAGIAMRIFGVSELAARLPSALAALLAVLAASWTALRSYGLGAAWYSLLMLPTSVALIGFSRAASPDMLFAGFLTASMAVAVEMLRKERPGTILRIAFGFCLGAAALAKGPAAVILAGGATLLWAALTKHWTASFRFLHPLIVVVFCATALPWYVLCALRNPDFLRVFIWQHNFERYATPVFEHRQPIWFYSYILILAVVPWIFFLFGGLIRAASLIKKRAAIDSGDLFFASWAAFPILFFSFSQSKLPSYILPSIPPIFVLLSRWVSESLGNHEKVVARTLGWTAAILLVLLIAPVGFAVIDKTNNLFPVFVMPAFAIAILVLAFKRRVSSAFLALSLMVPSVVALSNRLILPELDEQISARGLAKILESKGVSAGNIAVYRLPRVVEFGMDYYLNRRLAEWEPGKSAPEWILGGVPLPRLPVIVDYKLEDRPWPAEYGSVSPWTLPTFLFVELYHKK